MILSMGARSNLFQNTLASFLNSGYNSFMKMREGDLLKNGLQTIEKEKNMPETVNYSDADVVKLKELYAEKGNSGLDEIAKEFGKSVPSVRAKLVREGVYVKPEAAKTGTKRNDGPSKKELLAKLSGITGSKHEGLDAATKGAIQELIDLFSDNEVVQEDDEPTV